MNMESASQRVAAFQNLEKARERFMHTAKILEYEKGDIICVAGGADLAVRHYSSGCARSLIGPISKNELVGVFFRGTTEHFNDLLTGYNIYTVQALTKLVVYELSANRFDEMQEDAEFLRWCLWCQTRNSIIVSEYAALRSIAEVDDRIIGLLKILHEQQFGRHLPPKFEVKWPLSQGIFADVINVSRSYLNVHFQRLTQEGVLTIRQGSISVSLERWDEIRNRA